MSEDDKSMVRTAAEECICAVVAEAYYMDGGTPEELRQFIEKNPDLSRIYHKRPHIFRSRHNAVEDTYHESTDII